MTKDVRSGGVSRPVQDSRPVHPDTASAPGIERNRDGGCGDIRFRQFQLQPATRRLLRGGLPVEIGGRAFDLLFVLVTSPGTLLSKSTIIKYVWPSTIVEESSLRFQMASLRRVLADDRDVIKTIPGRGYLFAAEVMAEIMGSSGQSVARTAPRDISRFSDAKARGGHKPIVVIIEDDGDVRDALRNLLQATGLQVESFDSIRAFTSSRRSTAPNCFILDVWLPGESGLEFQEDLARAGMRAPIIFISGGADVPMSVRAMKAGAVEFLTKPVRHQDLLNAIHLAISSEAA